MNRPLFDKSCGYNRKNVYLNKLIEFKDTELVKVITGVRRSGKSMLGKNGSMDFVLSLIVISILQGQMQIFYLVSLRHIYQDDMLRLKDCLCLLKSF